MEPWVVFFIVLSSSLRADVLTGEMRVKLQAFYNNLKYAETGYGKCDTEDGDSAAANSVVGAEDCRLLTAIEQQYVDLKCGYIYSCLLHMKMVRAYLEDGGGGGGVHKDAVFELFFEKQVALMLATLYNSQIRKSAAELWMLFVHMGQLREYFHSDDRNRNEARPAVAKAHLALADHLRTLTKRYCKPDNKYNHRHVGSRFHRRFDITEGDRFQKAFYTGEHFIDMNKDMIERQMAFNVKYGVRTDGSEHITIRTLCLNGVMVNDYRLGNLKRMVVGPEGRVFDRLRSDYERARSNRWPDVQIKQLGRVHADFVHLLTVVVLRMVWKHVTYISRLIDFQRVSLSLCMTLLALPFHNMNVSRQLVEFLRFFDLPDDQGFDEIVDLLGSPIRNVFVKNNAALIADEIKTLLGKMSEQYKPLVDVAEPVSLEDDPSDDIVIQYYNKTNAVQVTPTKNDLGYWFNVSVARIEYFVEYVTWILRGIDFKIINYFIAVSNELQLIPKNAADDDDDLANASGQQN